MRNLISIFKQKNKEKREKEMKVLKLIQLHGGEDFLHIGEIHGMPEIPSMFKDYSGKINYSFELAECLRKLQAEGYLDFTPHLTKERKEYPFLGKVTAPAYKISKFGLANLRRENV